jgi:molecular chaperone GrpE
LNFAGKLFDRWSALIKRFMEKNQKVKDQTEMEDFEDIRIEENDAVNEKDESIHKKDKSKKHRKKDKDNEALEALQSKYDELNDKYLRLFSEFDNFRKRTLKEKIDLSKTASEEVIISLLTVVDDFERAMSILSNNKENNNNIEGISLIYNKLIKLLQQKGLEEMKASGEPFNTDFHEALTNIPAENESGKGKVLDVIQKGYTLNGKIIRFAKVVVGS